MIEFYPNSGNLAEKDAWTKYTDDKTNTDYWYNTVTKTVSILEP